MSGKAKKLTLREPDLWDIEQLERAIAAGADVNAALPAGSTPLGLAARLGNIEACKCLLEAGAHPDVGGSGRASPLSELIDDRVRRDMSTDTMEAIARLLLAHGANPNGDCRPGETLAGMNAPLWVAAQKGDHDAVRLLAEAGADLDRKFLKPQWFTEVKRTSTAFEVAQSNGDYPMLLTLLKLGADDSSLGYPKENETPFQSCVQVGAALLVEYYVRERGESLNQRIKGKRLEDVTGNTEMKNLIRALRTEMGVKESLEKSSAAADDVFKSVRAFKAAIKPVRDRVYSALLKAGDCGPFDGGCVLVARALQQVIGGHVVVVLRAQDRSADHAAVYRGGVLIDMDGPAAPVAFCRRFGKNEMVEVDGWRPMRKGDLPNAAASDKVEQELAELFQEAFAPHLEPSTKPLKRTAGSSPL